MTPPAAPLFASAKPIIAMIHVGALPGTPAAELDLVDLEKRVVREAEVFCDSGVQGLMLENMHDTPYLRGHVGPEIVAAMTIIARAVKQVSGLPCGIQILAGANTEALFAVRWQPARRSRTEEGAQRRCRFSKGLHRYVHRQQP